MKMHTCSSELPARSAVTLHGYSTGRHIAARTHVSLTTRRNVASIMKAHACSSELPARPAVTFHGYTGRQGAGRTHASRIARRNVAPVSGELVTGHCYEDMVDKLAKRSISRAEQAGSALPRYVVGVCGPPGAGKSTLVKMVVQRINDLSPTYPAIVVPMDGFHLYKRELDAMEDAKEAYARRGAHWTFDADKFVQCVKCVKEAASVSVPSFDHGVGDPIPNDIFVEPQHRIVLVEGNYLLLDIPPWNELAWVFDDTWFLELPLDVAMLRVFQRQTGLGISPGEAKKRINYNDYKNAQLVNECKTRAKVVVLVDLPFKT